MVAESNDLIFNSFNWDYTYKLSKFASKSYDKAKIEDIDLLIKARCIEVNIDLFNLNEFIMTIQEFNDFKISDYIRDCDTNLPFFDIGEFHYLNQDRIPEFEIRYLTGIYVTDKKFEFKFNIVDELTGIITLKLHCDKVKLLRS
jgi:hypothetical protein